MGASLCCFDADAQDETEGEHVKGYACSARGPLEVSKELGPKSPHSGEGCDEVIWHPVKSPVMGEDRFSVTSRNAEAIPRCNSYYGVVVNPPPATPRCTSFIEVPVPQATGPSETTTRLPSLPEDEVHCVPEPCKWDPVFLDLMLMHLDKAEELAYGTAFNELAGDDLDDIALDSRELRDFLVGHSVLLGPDLDAALRGAASEGGRLDMAGFLDLLRDNSVERASCQTWFDRALQLGATPDKDLTSEACLAGLRLFVANEAQRLPESALDEKQLERICTSATKAAGEAITFEEWTTYCKKVARTITLALHASDCNGF